VKECLTHLCCACQVYHLHDCSPCPVWMILAYYCSMVWVMADAWYAFSHGVVAGP
jgi:hypothetical protein